MPETVHNVFSSSVTIKEKYNRPFVASLGLHIAAFLLVIFGPYLLPRTDITIGTGLGGGIGGEVSTVGVIDELSGGAGMVKPSLVTKPPALEEAPPKSKTEAIPLPDTLERRIKKVPKTTKAPPAKSNENRIPTPAEAGSGGSGGPTGGSGGGVGGGIGISIGSGSGGMESHWYARTVEMRISDAWTKPPEGTHVDIIYRFYIDAYGRIQGIEKEKSSGNSLLDFMAESAIRNAKNIPPPPAEFQGRLIRFNVHFVYPPEP
jgi:TonB family protein